MFALTGWVGNKRKTVTWDNGTIDDADARQYVVDLLVAYSSVGVSVIVTPSMQEANVTLSDPVFVHTKLLEYFDVFEGFKGDMSFLESKEGVIF